MSRYTPPRGGRPSQRPVARRPRWLRVSVIALLVGVVALVLVDIFFVLLG
jgi:hypothetical protein